MSDDTPPAPRGQADPADGPDDTPYRFERSHAVGEVVEAFEGLEAGVETETVVSVAGRLMLRRDQGRLAFGTLQDATGRIQLFATAAASPGFDRFTALSIGDWIGVRGVVMATRRGELSVRVDDWTRLARAQRPFPDKWHGLTDPDTRYRQRYVDLWVSDEARAAFARRSQIVAALRRRLDEQGFVEVETPVLHPIPGGAAARPFVTRHEALHADLYLRVAPELYLKRLVVGGMERVYEIARVFRNEGISTRHNPEFTMLELYQAYADHTDIMELTEHLVAGVARDVCGSTTVVYDGQDVDLAPPWRRATMEEVIAEHTGLDVSLEAGSAELEALCDRLGIEIEAGWGPGKLLLEIYEKTAEPNLWGPVFVTDYPEEVSPLSRRHRSRPGYAERFEAIVAGRELCNAFTELVDPAEQRSRFEAQAELRAAGDDEAMVVDEDYLRSLEYGLPPTGGLGIGVDRLVMLLTDTQAIRDAVLFPTLRPDPQRPSE
ncbi:MAG: lysine--tRNA ligase [Acidimicrobiaceae bacterium]|nr:lysine--tRNA ligase [Acidimicrobiaceae bacterium]